MMRKALRQRLALIAVAALVALNIWRWWPSDDYVAPVHAPLGRLAIAPGDFQVQGVLAVDAPDDLVRDVFALAAPQMAVIDLVPIVPEPIAMPIVAPAEPAPSRSHLAAYRLEGTLVQTGRVSAFLSKADAHFLVTQGTRLSDGVRVERVEAESVVLRDPDGSRHTLRLQAH